MLPKAWEPVLIDALHAVCFNAATLPINFAMPQNYEHELSNSSSSSLSGSESNMGLSKPDANAPRVFFNLTAGQNADSWLQFVTTGIRRTQSAFPGTLPVSIKTYSCGDRDYPQWNYLDCYIIAFFGPTSITAVTIEGRWDQLNARLLYWFVPIHSPGRRGSQPVVPWPPFVGLEAAEGLARGMGHTQSYHTVTLNGVAGSKDSLYYMFFSSEAEP